MKYYIFYGSAPEILTEAKFDGAQITSLQIQTPFFLFLSCFTFFSSSYMQSLIKAAYYVHRKNTNWKHLVTARKFFNVSVSYLVFWKSNNLRGFSISVPWLSFNKTSAYYLDLNAKPIKRKVQGLDGTQTFTYSTENILLHKKTSKN